MLIRTMLKRLVFIAGLVLVSPLLAVVWLEKHLFRGELLFVTFAHLVALLPGAPGNVIRAAYYFGTLDRCSPEVHIGFGSVFTHRGATVSRRVSMGLYCVIGHVDFGENIRMASHVSIPSGKRQHLDADGNMTDATTFERVAIGKRCWIGEGAIIMDDVGDGAIVSAGAVVTKPVAASTLVAGNPASVLKQVRTATPAVPEGG